jgi:hypothetical protein
VAAERVRVARPFTRRYDLVDGGLSARRETAEFVGERVATTVERADRRGVTLPLDPPAAGSSPTTGAASSTRGPRGRSTATSRSDR